MRILTNVELANTRKKLRDLESLYESKKAQTVEDEELRDITMESLTRLINQLKEEISWSETRQLTR